MLNKPDSLPSKPSFDQLLQQGVIQKLQWNKLYVSWDDLNTDSSMCTGYIIPSRFCPPIPKEEDWMSLEWLTNAEILWLDELLQAAQKDGIVFKRDDSWSIFIEDRWSIGWYKINWYLVNTESRLSRYWVVINDNPSWMNNNVDEYGVLKVLSENSPHKTINDILIEDAQNPWPIEDKYKDLPLSEEEPYITTHIAFDMDTVFNLKWTYDEVRSNMQKRTNELMNWLSRNSPN